MRHPRSGNRRGPSRPFSAFCAGRRLSLLSAALIAVAAFGDPPEILTQPASQTVCLGQPAAFSVVVADSDPPATFQWRRDGAPIAGAVLATYSIASATETHAGVYDVEVAVGVDAVVSDPATLTVNALRIDAQPSDQTACPGDNVTLSVGLPPLDPPASFQWRKNDEPIPGASGPDLTLIGVALGDEADYDVQIDHACGTLTSQAATLSVGEVVFAQQPEDAAVCDGEAAQLSVSIQGVADGVVDVVGSTARNGAAAVMRGGYYHVTQGTTLTRIEHYLSLASPTDLRFYVYRADAQAGPYALVALDTVAGAGTGARFYASNPLNIPLDADAYYIIAAGWPAAQQYYYAANSPPRSVSFGRWLAGFQNLFQDPPPDPPPYNSSANAHHQRLTTSEIVETYQWFHEGVALPGASGATLTIDPVGPADAGAYHVEVSNVCVAPVASDSAMLSVAAAPTITSQPSSASVCEFTPVSFAVAVSDAGVAYQWRRDGAPLAGQTGPTLDIAQARLSDAGVYDVVITNAQGCADATSAPALLDVNDAPPTITVDPLSRGVCAGAGVALSVTASNGPLEYRWRFEEVEIADANAPTYVVSDFDASAAGDYDVLVSNACGAVGSAVATLTLDEPLALRQPPAPARVCAGNPVTFAALVDGAGQTYQWRKDGQDIAGATQASYTIASVAPADAGAYSLVASNACGSLTTATAALSVAQDLTITAPPESRCGFVDASVTFSVQVDAADLPFVADTVGQVVSEGGPGARVRANLYRADRATRLTRIEQYLRTPTAGTVQFFVYDAPAASGPFTLRTQSQASAAVGGARFVGSAALDEPLEAGRYYLVGASWPGAYYYYWGAAHPVATAFGESLAGFAAPYQEPLPVNPIASGANVYVQRLTTQDAPAYQWRKDGAPLAGQVSEALTLTNLQPADQGAYDVVVQSACASATSAAAQLTVHSGITITQQPAAGAVCEGDPLTLSVAALGDDLRYRWRRDEVELADANAPVLDIPNAGAADAGDYDVVISDACSSITSAVATVTVSQGPGIVSPPADALACLGAPLALSVVATGAAPLGYQWSRAGQPLPGATSATYQIAAVGAGDLGSYAVAVSNACGTTLSPSATVSLDTATPGCALAGDLDGDGDVDVLDLAALLNGYGATSGATRAQGDLDDDGDVDIIDLAQLLSNFGRIG